MIDYDFKRASAVVKGRLTEDVKHNLRMVRDQDHWFGGKYWKGARPAYKSSYEQHFWQQLARVFVPSDVLSDVVTTHVNGAAGHVPLWKIVARAAEGDDSSAASDEVVQQAIGLITQWLRKKRAHNVVKDAAKLTPMTGRGVLRLFVPEWIERDEETGTLEDMDLNDARDAICIEAPASEVAAVEGDGRWQTGLFLFKRDKQNYAETVRLIDGQTVWEQWQNGEEAFEATWAHDLGGLLPMFEMRTPILITKSIRAQQMAINVSSTGMLQNTNEAGFREVYVFNAETFEEVTNPETGKPELVPVEMERGPGVVQYLSGIEQESESGANSYTRPDVKALEPAKNEVFIGAMEFWRNWVYRLVSQDHRAYSNREVASMTLVLWLNEFENELVTLAEEIASAYQWMILCVLKMAAVFAREPKLFDGLTVTVTPRLRVGDVTVELRKEVREAYGAGLYSLETALRELGVEEPQAEIEKIKAEQLDNQSE